MWRRTSKAVSHEGADLELDALAYGKQVTRISDKFFFKKRYGRTL